MNYTIKTKFQVYGIISKIIIVVNVLILVDTDR